MSDSATKEDIQKLQEFLVKNMATKDDIAELKSEIAEIRVVQNNHTESLDSIVKQLKIWHDEHVVLKERLDRQDVFLKQVAEKLGLSYQPFGIMR